jgi:hypothetical protein
MLPGTGCEAVTPLYSLANKIPTEPTGIRRYGMNIDISVALTWKRPPRLSLQDLTDMISAPCLFKSIPSKQDNKVGARGWV